MNWQELCSEKSRLVLHGKEIFRFINEQDFNRIQLDARIAGLKEAAIISSSQKVPSGTKDWNGGYHLATKHASTAILNRVRELDSPKKEAG